MVGVVQSKAEASVQIAMIFIVFSLNSISLVLRPGNRWFLSRGCRRSCRWCLRGCRRSVCRKIEGNDSVSQFHPSQEVSQRVGKGRLAIFLGIFLDVLL